MSSLCVAHFGVTECRAFFSGTRASGATWWAPGDLDHLVGLCRRLAHPLLAFLAIVRGCVLVAFVAQLARGACGLEGGSAGQLGDRGSARLGPVLRAHNHAAPEQGDKALGAVLVATAGAGCAGRGPWRCRARGRLRTRPWRVRWEGRGSLVLCALERRRTENGRMWPRSRHNYSVLRDTWEVLITKVKLTQQVMSLLTRIRTVGNHRARQLDTSQVFSLCTERPR